MPQAPHAPSTLTLSFLLMLIMGCGAPPVLEESLDRSPGVTPLHGTIVNIVEVQEKASFGSELGGALVGGALGSLVGGGTGKSIAIGVGSVAGSQVADHALGDVAHRLTLRENKTGLTFKVLVHSNGFMMDDRVVFTVQNGRVTSIIHQALLNSR